MAVAEPGPPNPSGPVRSCRGLRSWRQLLERDPVQKLVYGPERGDVVVFSDPKGVPPIARSWAACSDGCRVRPGSSGPRRTTPSKRVIGQQGETVELRNLRPSVHGARVPERCLRGPLATGDDGRPVVVHDDALFVVGDIRTNSNDSRFGFIARDKVIGTAFAVVWPSSRGGWIH